MILIFSYHYNAISWYDEMMIGEIKILQNIHICSTLFFPARWEGRRCCKGDERSGQSRNLPSSFWAAVAAVPVSPWLTALQLSERSPALPASRFAGQTVQCPSSSSSSSSSLSTDIIISRLVHSRVGPRMPLRLSSRLLRPTLGTFLAFHCTYT